MHIYKEREREREREREERDGEGEREGGREIPICDIVDMSKMVELAFEIIDFFFFFFFQNRQDKNN
jgi:hypothetical protein